LALVGGSVRTGYWVGFGNGLLKRNPGPLDWPGRMAQIKWLIRRRFGVVPGQAWFGPDGAIDFGPQNLEQK